jgi:peptidoglycan/xylan/chitin deacetylase (PgdA/CDA1 family)
MDRPTPFLMYHEVLEPGRTPARPGAGYARYVIDRHTLREQLAAIRDTALIGVDVTAALEPAETPNRRVALTFDDGCETDLVVAAPLLVEYGFTATFFVTAGHLDSPGFMAAAQLRELADTGFEIGSHSMSHAYLSDLDEKALRHEIAGSMDQLSQIVGRPIRHLSCPGGRWSRRVADLARELGYVSVADSRPRANTVNADPFRLGRFAVTDSTSLDQLMRICRDGRLPGFRARSLVLGAARSVLGNRFYDRARQLILESDDD